MVINILLEHKKVKVQTVNIVINSYEDDNMTIVYKISIYRLYRVIVIFLGLTAK